jgi:hypothetical protein
MSLILDALHRSDQERNNENAVPGIQTRHGEPGVVHSPVRWLLAGLVVLLVFAALVGWIITGDRSTGDDGESAPPQPAVAAALPAAPRSSATEVSPVSASAAVEAPVSAETRLREAGTERQDPGVAETHPVLVVNSALDAPAREQVAELYQRRAAPVATDIAPAPGADKDQALPVDAIVAAVEQELVAPPLDENPIPLVQELPQGTKDQIPSIFFSSHSWSGKPSEKVVTMNGEIRREGDVVAQGVRLIEILPESVVLDFQGTRFRLRALNSWVNL